ncbi:MerR family transcriptional regulator [Tissierella sp. MSJ-40]|uniref:MerR family transcriptional regulator n=1 Tax=Tissierella simiarum TaxID=2841534 RepID=A0ABS6E7G7_9FIRM|nr:MerR family transcriptional regulator [Tissierella simiarum]MBU5438857.1 MerR family transcriptional regulator [Tissierella simiarum]
MEGQHLLTIGELAKKMDTTVRTLQYYDKEGLLKPSAKSQGGRRLYTEKDIIRLHQILSMKYLGFTLDEIKNHLISLDTPQQVIEVLEQQKEAVQKQIDNLTNALSAIIALQNEVRQMQQVDFGKYADIISLLRLKNEGYWIVKHFDNRLMTHLKERFSNYPDLAHSLFEEWKNLCDETIHLKNQGEIPEGEKGQELARKWWTMVMEFTGGDMSLIPALLQFNQSKQNWDKEMREKQSIVDEFIEPAINFYFQNQGIKISEMEENL